MQVDSQGSIEDIGVGEVLGRSLSKADCMLGGELHFGLNFTQSDIR